VRSLFAFLIATQVMPTNHGHTLCTFHEADESVMEQAVQAAADAKIVWANMPKEDRW
tara:strand:- start:811 stop:981 length:171 start_codon:yes stop_codon:yes gene_type:complete